MKKLIAKYANASVRDSLSLLDQAISICNNSVKIDPPVEGKFVQNGRVWILKQLKPLLENTTYTITVDNTIKKGTKQLKETFKSTFSTYAGPRATDSKINVNYFSNTIDNIATFRSSDNPMFVTKGDIVRVEMVKFNSSDDFIKYITIY